MVKEMGVGAAVETQFTLLRFCPTFGLSAFRLLCFSVCFSLRLLVHRYFDCEPPVRKISELCELFAAPQTTAHTTTNKIKIKLCAIRH